MAKGPFMEFLRATISQSATNAYAQIQIPTPTSKTENMAMLIHSIELLPTNLVAAAPATTDHVRAHLASKSKTSVSTIVDPDVLAYYKAFTSLNAVFNDTLFFGEQKQTFNPPILYPHANLFAAIQSMGFAAVITLTCRIGYTLEKVSREDFISALVE
jgi:hypothetical protein